jgi:hypothetical protein
VLACTQKRNRTRKASAQLQGVTQRQGYCRVPRNRIPKEGSKASQRRPTNRVAQLPSNSVWRSKRPPRDGPPRRPACLLNKYPPSNPARRGCRATYPPSDPGKVVEQLACRATQRGGTVDQPAHRTTQQEDSQLSCEHPY